MPCPAAATSQNFTVFRRESLPATRLQLPKGRLRLRIPVRVVRKQCGAVEVTGIGSADGGDAHLAPRKSRASNASWTGML